MHSMMDLSGKQGVVVGIANEHSLAYACAKLFNDSGAKVIATYANESAARFVLPLQSTLEGVSLVCCDLSDESSISRLLAIAESHLGPIDFIVHSIAFAPMADLHGRLIDCSQAGFQEAIEVSCFSLVRLVSKFENILNAQASVVTMSYLGSQRAIQNYNVMGPIKSALDSSVRYLAMELGDKGCRVNAISAGPIKTRAASGLKNFEQLIEKSHAGSPLQRDLSSEDVAKTAMYLVSDLSQAVTGSTIYVDNGYHVMG
ncbi:enoyl-ACP reductase FabI [Pseudoalteromonas luteoviolacea]|nr:SDR family oxidoreductase [Pseudoalteromonas luteoviolacea]